MRHMPRRNTAGYDLSAAAQKVVDEFCDAKGMTKKAVVERVMRWFSRQPPFVKSMVAGLVDDEMESHYASALESWAKELRGGASFTDLGAIDSDPREAHARKLRAVVTRQTARMR
jgi:hypothetical protein